LRELLDPVERGNEGDWKEALGGHFAPQEEVSLQIVRGEVVLDLMFDVVGENLLSHVVVDATPVVKEVRGAHNRGHESWILTRVAICRYQAVEGEGEELLPGELASLLLLSRFAAPGSLAQVFPILLLLPAGHPPPLLPLLQPLRLVALRLDQVRSHLPLLLLNASAFSSSLL